MPQAFAINSPSSLSQHHLDNLRTFPVVTDYSECVAVPEQELYMNKLLELVWSLVEEQYSALGRRFQFLKEMKTFIKILKVVNGTDEGGEN
ncbi:hypothetical protein AVEN_35862-1 [Araneus ventricosus]|uniref:Uncharacterized protein n=1 Tax=Araneus ventricosus TaxID=182803 RepID=A0A4Y2BKT4_ARAVE|nr:hypothetical protein AVEN_35862-1 [Araneus ventricosus]